MLEFSFFLLGSFSISSLILFYLMIGEYYVKKYPNSKFKKWWNRHIIVEINDNL
jgi:hypothetical protein